MTKASPAPFTGRGPALPPSRRTISVGIIGLGTVGTGTVKVLVEHQRELERRLGWKLQLKTICSRSIHKRDLSWLRQPVNTTRDWRQVVADPKVDIVVELVGELRTARAIANAALGAGKHLVTANKQLVAEHGVELVERSQAAGVNLGIEACVAGGTPVLHAIREGLAAENFVAVYGILNGTTNYILTEMERSGCDFREALAEAQEKGYAEPDPTFDVEGYDARYKVAILSMLCFGRPGRGRRGHSRRCAVRCGRNRARHGGGRRQHHAARLYDLAPREVHALGRERHRRLLAIGRAGPAGHPRARLRRPCAAPYQHRFGASGARPDKKAPAFRDDARADARETRPPRHFRNRAPAIPCRAAAPAAVRRPPLTALARPSFRAGRRWGNRGPSVPFATRRPSRAASRNL